MLNRRYIRVKVFQALYAFFESGEDADILTFEKNIFKSIDKIYDLYLYLLLTVLEFRQIAEEIIETRKNKFFPTEEDLNPNLKFINNKVIDILFNNQQFLRAIEQRKINWSNDREELKKIWKEIAQSDDYKKYMSNRENDFEEDKSFLIKILKKYLFTNELIQFLFEERSIYWEDDYALAAVSTVKTIRQLSENTMPHDNILLPLYKDQEDDTDFLKSLFRTTIKHSKEFEQLIASKTQNWEIDRIAVIDKILMEMALAEMLYFPNIPYKVTINEYIELSKHYSTPKSRIFINGILDKLYYTLKNEGKIKKAGRGLIDK
ncbi:MAG: transcription antitermination factor NusB [Bacteroidetes bacterium]|nr:MAG: transcription antitermination factor NusB [Bacteroidota bacterium]